MPDVNPPTNVAVQKSLPSAPPVPHSSPAGGAIGEGADAGSVYKPLSLLAIVGLGLAVPYALFIIIGAFVAFYSGSPFLLGGVFALAPLAAAILSGAALIRINRSEGVLGGAKLALWGLRLSLLFGLGYWAYFTATYLAVRQQADEFARKWIQRISDGQTTSAFLLVIDPKFKPPKENPENPNDPRVVDQLEKRFNGASQQNPRGMFSRFPEHDIVRFIRQMSPDRKVEFLGSSDWEHKDGHMMGLRYRISSKEGAIIMKVTVQGMDSDEDGSPGRRWFVHLDQSKVESRPEFTAEGERKMQAMGASKNFTQDWLMHLGLGYLDRAYLDTLDQKESIAGQEILIKTYLPMLTSVPNSSNVPAGTLGSMLGTYFAFANWEKTQLPNYAILAQGKLVQADPKGFSVPDPDLGQMVIRDVKAAFQRPDQDFLPFIKVDPNTMPLVKEEGDKLVVELDFTFNLYAKHIIVEGVFVLDADKAVGENGKPYAFRMKSVDLRRAKKIDAEGGRMQRMTPGGQPPPGGGGMPRP